jgi:hypothetical protein
MKVGDQIIIMHEYSEHIEEGYHYAMIVEKISQEERDKFPVSSEFRVLFSNGHCSIPTDDYLRMFKVVQTIS